jgi:hypothetical protein
MPEATLSVDHQWDIDGYLIGDGQPFIFVSADGFDMPEFRTSITPRPQEHGDFHLGPDFLSGRYINMTIGMADTYGSATYQPRIDALKRAMRPRDDDIALRWRYNNAEIRRLYCRPFRPPVFSLDESAYMGVLYAHMQFHCADPRIYTDAEYLSTLTPGTTIGGLGFPHGFPFGFGSTIPGEGTVSNFGTTGTYPYGRITAIGGGITGWRLDNISTGRNWSMTTPLAAGEFIDFDFKNKSVMLNGTANRNMQVDRPGSEWWAVEPGDNLVSFRVTALSGGSASLDLRTRSAWL